jgi:hypothetical protein
VLDTAEQIRALLLVGFQRELMPLGWLGRKLMGKPPSIGYVQEFATIRMPGRPAPEALRAWRITAAIIEPISLGTPIPKPTVFDGMFYDIATFSFTLPDDSGVGTESSQLGPRYGSGFEYRVVATNDTIEIQLGERLWVS